MLTRMDGAILPTISGLNYNSLLRQHQPLEFFKPVEDDWHN